MTLNKFERIATGKMRENIFIEETQRSQKMEYSKISVDQGKNQSKERLKKPSCGIEYFKDVPQLIVFLCLKMSIVLNVYKF